jgi:acetylornithine deacetylase/succinyl-diaminopimelate desuccinylase-like protein
MELPMRLISTLVIASLAAAPAAAEDMVWRGNGRQIMSDIVAIPSVSDRPAEVKRMVAYLKDRFEKGGIGDVMVKDHDGTQSMIVRWKAEGGKAPGKAKKKPIMLIGHMDVVEALPSDWSKDPFKLTEDNGYLYGRGATDMKNGITAITNALIWLKAEGFKPKRDIIVLFTGDEETEGNGARRAVSDWLKGERIDFALNADAGGGGFLANGSAIGFGLQTSEKMYQSYAFTVRNAGGHSSRPRPDNAIYQLADALKRLEKHRFSPQLNETTRAYFAHRQKGETGKLGDAMRAWLANPADGAAADIVEADPTETGMTRTRCVATRLEGGHADNALPALAKATVNCRIFPGLAEADVRAELKTLVGAGVEITPLADAVPSPPSPLRADVVKAFTDSIHKRHPGASIVPQMSTGATDGLFLRASGIPTYGVDGTWIVVPDDERAHGRDERIPVKSFNENLDHWHDLVKALAG